METEQKGSSPDAVDSLDIASRFVQARLNAEALPRYPGTVPEALDTSYAIQDRAIELWPDLIAGWKVGGLLPDQAALHGVERLAGPIFARQVWNVTAGQAVAFPVFADGFAAVEAEIVFVLGADAPAGKTEWSREEAATLVARAHLGVETAGSPLATINDLGPTVIVSDFGNNHGLLLGDELPGWPDAIEAGVRCETFIDGRSVGAKDIDRPPRGPVEALRFLLALNARRGRPLRKGDLVSSGAITGVHDILPGQRARIVFGDSGSIECVAESATAQVA